MLVSFATINNRTPKHQLAIDPHSVLLPNIFEGGGVKSFRFTCAQLGKTPKVNTVNEIEEPLRRKRLGREKEIRKKPTRSRTPEN